MSEPFASNGQTIGWNIMHHLNEMLNEMDGTGSGESIAHSEVVFFGEAIELRFPDIKVLCGLDMVRVGTVAAKYGFEATLNGYEGVVAIHLWAHDTTENDAATETQNTHT